MTEEQRRIGRLLTPIMIDETYFELAECKDDYTEEDDPDPYDGSDTSVLEHQDWMVRTWDAFDATLLKDCKEGLQPIARELADTLPEDAKVGDFYNLLNEIEEDKE